MFSIEKLISELEPVQVKITEEDLNNKMKFKKDPISSYNQKKIKSYTKDNSVRLTTELPISLTDKLTVLNEYYYKYNKYNNSFLSSILNAIDPNFEYLSNKKEVITYTKQQLGYKLCEHHRDFGYSRKRIFKRDKMQKYLFDKYDIDDDKYNMIRKYIVDYFNINVIIINKLAETEIVFSQRDNDIFIPQRPTVIMYHHDKRYISVYNKKADDSLYMYNKYMNLIDSLVNSTEDVYKNSIVKKDKLNMNAKEEEVVVDAKEEVAVAVKEEVVVDAKEEVAVDAKEEVAVDAKEEVVVDAKEEVVVDVKEEVVVDAKEEVVVDAKEEVVVAVSVKNDAIYTLKAIAVKLKLTELVEYANKYNIDIYKTSPSTGKKIKKLKKDLIEDINNLAMN